MGRGRESAGTQAAGDVNNDRNGRFARVLSRTPEVRPDLMQAARDVLKFNGYDPAGLQPI